MSLATYQQLVDNLVRDDAARIKAEDRDRAITAAVERLSRVVPQQRVRELAGVAGQRIAIPTEWGWSVGASRVVQIEYPVGDTPPTFIDRARVMLIDLPNGAQEIGLQDALPAGSTIRVTFTLPHAIDSQSDTVPRHLEWGVAALAASILCGQLASFYANQTDSTIGADAVDHKAKSELWAAREREYEKRAYASWGVPLPQSAAATAGQPAATVVSFTPRRDPRLVQYRP